MSSALLRAALGLTILSLACKPKLSVGHVNSLAPSDMSALLANHCIDKARAEMQRIVLPTPSNAEETKRLSPYLAIIADSSSGDDSFEQTTHSTRLDSLSASHAFAVDNREVKIDYGLTAKAASIGDASTASYLELVSTYSLGYEMIPDLVVADTFRIAAVGSGCSRLQTQQDVTSFGDHSGASVPVHFVSTNLVTGQVINSVDISVDKSLFLAADPMAEVLSGQTTSATYKTYGSPTAPVQTITAAAQGVVNMTDPMTQTAGNFVSLAVDLQSSGSDIQMTMLAAANSKYHKTTVDLLHSVSEAITKEMFLAAQLNAVDGSTDTNTPSLRGFAQGDFEDPGLTYALGKDSGLTFDNYSAYFSVTPISAEAVPDAPGGITSWVRVTNTPRQEDPALQQAFAASTGDGLNYLKESYYLDFSDGLVQAHVQKVLSKLPQPYRYQDLVQAILDDVTSSIQYDYASTAAGAVSLMKASDALKAGKGVCQHYSAAFVAIARALQLPARVTEGYYLSQDKGQVAAAGGHAWVEVYAGGKWIPLEPQDNRHLVIPGDKYLPSNVMTAYELTNQDPASAGSNLETYKAMSGFVLVRLQSSPR